MLQVTASGCWFRLRAGALLFAVSLMVPSVARAQIAFTSFTTPPAGVLTTANNGTIGFTYAGDMFVGSVYHSGFNCLYSTDLSGGSQKVFAPTVSIPGGDPEEHFVASSLGQAGFLPREIYVAIVGGIIHISHDGTTSSNFVTGLNGGVRGIIFDPVGSFGHDMLVTTSTGYVYRINSSGVPTVLAMLSEDAEGMDVAPLTFPLNPGYLYVASEKSGNIRAISPAGAVTVVANVTSAEMLSFVPTTFGGNPVEGFYASNYRPNVIYAGPAQFKNYLGDIIVTGETTHDVTSLHWNGSVLESSPMPVGQFPDQPEDGIFVTQSITNPVQDGFVEVCKSSSISSPVTGDFKFTIAGSAFSTADNPLVVPVGTCSGPIKVAVPLPPGTVTVTELPKTGTAVSAIKAFGYDPTSVEESLLVKSDLPSGTAMVKVMVGDSSTETIVDFTNYETPTGILEVCKDAAPGGPPVMGAFSFTVSGAPNNPYVLPAGACSGPILVQAGSVTITEAPRAGFQLVDVDTIPLGRLVSTNIPGGSAVVTVAAGDVSTETVARFINGTVSPDFGQLKICKIAGPGIALGQVFTIFANDMKYSVPAGPAAQGGYCVLDGTFPVGTVVTVQEQISLTTPPAYQVLNIAVNPPNRINGTADLVNGKAGVTIGTGFTEVTFTNIGSTPTGQLKICKIAGPGITVGTNFTFTAKGPDGTQTFTVPAGPTSEGGYCVVDGTFPLQTQVSVAEVTPTGTILTGVTVNGKPVAKGNGTVPVTIGPDFTEMAFTNSALTLQPQACSGQGLITIDPVHSTGYVPIYTLDGSGNAQVAVVDLTGGAVLGKISLPGTNRPLATAYNPNNQTMLAEAANTNTGAITVFEIDTITRSLKSTIPTPGVTFPSPFRWGGLLVDSPNNRAFVAGSLNIGILDTSTSTSTTPPSWSPTSVVGIPLGTDSLSLNLATGLLFISGDGTNVIIDTTTSPLVPMSFDSSFFTTDGNAFDPATNILLLSQEVGADQTWAFNFATLNTTFAPRRGPQCSGSRF